VFCSSCGESISPDSKFCSSCGSPIVSKIKTPHKNENRSKEIQMPTSLPPPINEEVLVGLEVLKIERKNNNIKFISAIICMVIIWFIAFNPAQGNILNITYLDLATMECELGEGEIIEFLGEELLNTGEWQQEAYDDCKEIKNKALMLVTGGVILCLILIIYAFTDKGKIQTNKVNTEIKFDKNLDDLTTKNEEKSRLKKLITDRNLLEIDLNKFREDFELIRSEWESLIEKDKQTTHFLKKIFMLPISIGMLFGILLVLISALFIKIPGDNLEDYLSYILYISWAIPILFWLKFSLVIKSDDPKVKLNNSIQTIEAKLVNLNKLINDLTKKLGEEE